ncbi:MAG: TauD/TfdA family dioxygenase [Sphingomonas sp.]
MATAATIESEDLGKGVRCWSLPQGGPPLFISCPEGIDAPDAMAEWIMQHRAALDRLILQHGGIVLRGFPLVTALDFERITRVFPAYEPGYVGGASPRGKVVGNVMQATQLGPEVAIPQHQEMAYLPHYPARIAFFCRKPADTGGATSIADMRAVTRDIPDWLRDGLAEHGVRGVLNFAAPPEADGEVVSDTADNKPWSEVYGTRDRAEVEKVIADLGQTPIWHADNSLTVLSHLPAFAEHPDTGERLYRSILHTNYLTYEGSPHGKARRARLLAAGKPPTGYTLGNGHELTRDESRELERAFDDHTVDWEWQAGDLMILDNLLVSHGRAAFTGERETLVAIFGRE